jgi:peptidyl-tRNA hydrolase, PTH1 family
MAFSLFHLFSKKETPDLIPNDMKYLIVGLGNIGDEYEDTRHNIGFQVLDTMVTAEKLTWKADRFGQLAEYRLKGKTLYLQKPDTYMNLSGNAIRFWMQKLKIQPENLLVVLDDLNLSFGTIRVRKNGSDGGHNGLKSIQSSLNTIDYARMRVGIGNAFVKGRQVNYVLGRWTKEESEALANISTKCTQGIKTFALAGIDKAMNEING